MSPLPKKEMCYFHHRGSEATQRTQRGIRHGDSVCASKGGAPEIRGLAGETRLAPTVFVLWRVRFT